jgi:hypothetical protein
LLHTVDEDFQTSSVVSTRTVVDDSDIEPLPRRNHSGVVEITISIVTCGPCFLDLAIEISVVPRFNENLVGII